MFPWTASPNAVMTAATPYTDGAVNVMAASMHHTGNFGAIGDVINFVDGEGVHIHPQRDGRFGGVGDPICDQAVPAHPRPDLPAQFLKC